MSYSIAAIDVHKKMLAVVVADIAVQGEYDFERRQFSSSPDQLRLLAEWLVEQKIQEVVMESTAQYGRPVWQTLEQHWKADCAKVGRCWSDVGNATSGAGAVESRAPRAQERFRRCRTASLAHCSAPEVPVDVRPGAAAEPVGVSAGRSTRPVVQFGLGSAWVPAHGVC